MDFFVTWEKNSRPSEYFFVTVFSESSSQSIMRNTKCIWFIFLVQKVIQIMFPSIFYISFHKKIRWASMQAMYLVKVWLQHLTDKTSFYSNVYDFVQPQRHKEKNNPTKNKITRFFFKVTRSLKSLCPISTAIWSLICVDTLMK